MKSARHPFLCVFTAAAFCMTGCLNTPDTPDTSHPATTNTKKPEPAKKPEPTTLKDQNGDQSFLAFLSRLRQAIRAHDVDTLASMMTTDFGYQYPDGEGKGVFEYWDQNNVWPELELVIKERFVPKGSAYMVAPAEFATDPDHYSGYRAGLKLENGSWKFAYFITG